MSAVDAVEEKKGAMGKDGHAAPVAKVLRINHETNGSSSVQNLAAGRPASTC
jgi:hypothetical protein